MTDPILTPTLSPTDPSGVTASLERGKIGTLPTGKVAPTNTGIPELDAVNRAFQQATLGRTIDMYDHDMIDNIMRMSSGRRWQTGLVMVPPSVNTDWRPDAEIEMGAKGIGRAVMHGLEGSTLGAVVNSIRRWASFDATASEGYDPAYNPYDDPFIKNSKYADRPELFETVKSQHEAKWLMSYLDRHEKEAEVLSRMTGSDLFTVAGGMLGDPLNFIPATLGVKGVRLASKTAALTSPETYALGFKPVVWGAVKDSMRAAGAQAAVALVDAGVHGALDPTYTPGSIADVVSLPAAIAASVGLVTGGLERYQHGMDAMKRAAGNDAFKAGVRAAPRYNPLGEGPAAPGVVSDAERAYWERAARANPAGRFHVDGRVVGVEGDNALFRTSEGKEVAIPLRDVDEVSAKSPRGIVIAADALLKSDDLMASAMRLDGDFVGGGRPALKVHDNTKIYPGELATDYADMRLREMQASGVARLVDADGIIQMGHHGTADRGWLENTEISQGNLSSAGAGGSTSRAPQLAGNRMVPTGIGIEKLPFDIVNRAAALPFTTWQTTIEDMVSSGGRLRMKNTAAFGHQANVTPVEVLIRTEWTHPTVEVIRDLRDQWQALRSQGVVSGTDAGRIVFELKTTLTDRLGRTNGISFEEFRRRVGDALINGDADMVSDSATKSVNAAAKKVRQLLEKVKREATDVGLFKEAHEEQLNAAKAKVAYLKKVNAAADAIHAAEQAVNRVQKLLDDVIAGGPTVSTAKSYRPRIWLHDQLVDKAAEFKDIVDRWLKNTQPSLDAKQRADIATNIHETLLRDKPVWTKKEIDKNFEDLADPGNAKARTFTIPDVLVKDFLENDVEAIVRSHSRTMGTAIEMHRRFGSTGMEDQIAELHREAKILEKAAPTNEAKREIIKKYDLALSDLEATRDRLYGVYGAPTDPHRWQSRLVRMAKQYTNLTTLGMAGVTAMADLVRPVMTEGLMAVHEYGFKTLASEMRGTILKMSRKELELAGEGVELINNTRALSMSDAGDLYRSRTPFERGLAKANSWFFVMNGLNAVNQIDKEWAGVIIQGNMNRAIIALSLNGKVEPALKARLAAAGIDESMASRMAQNLTYGSKGHSRFGKLILADTEKWSDDYAAQTYRGALNQMVNRTVPTPGLADTPNWMSTEMGSLMAQYKAFAFGALNRSLYAGLQEEGRKFWFHAATAVGFAMILNEIRSRLFYDRSTFDKPMQAVVLDAVDRSSVLGYFSDANRAIETLTGHRAGLRPWSGAQRPREESGSRIVSTIGGPAAGQAVNALSVLGDFFSLHPTAKTFADARQLIPGQNVPYLDPAFDHLISDGNIYPKKKKRGE